MDNYLNELHDMCETLNRALKEANEKIRNGGGKLSVSDIDFVNKLTHSIKSVKATIAMIEAEEMDDGENSYGYDNRGYSRRMYRNGSYDDGNYARGRGRYANRDSMGRYSSDGYSRGGGMVDELRELMNSAPDDATRQDLQRMIQRMEQR